MPWSNQGGGSSGSGGGGGNRGPWGGQGPGGRPQSPVERTLLVSGVLDALMESRHRGHVRIETPHLMVAYKPF